MKEYELATIPSGSDFLAEIEHDAVAEIMAKEDELFLTTAHWGIPVAIACPPYQLVWKILRIKLEQVI